MCVCVCANSNRLMEAHVKHTHTYTHRTEIPTNSLDMYISIINTPLTRFATNMYSNVHVHMAVENAWEVCGRSSSRIPNITSPLHMAVLYVHVCTCSVYSNLCGSWLSYYTLLLSHTPSCTQNYTMYR